MKSSIRSMAQSALMTALMCLFSQIAIPIGVTNMTLQTFVAAWAGYMLKPRAAVMTVGAYILIGACGMPVFSGFAGGFGVLLGPTGGFLFGFLPMALLCAFSRERGCGWAARIGMGLIGLTTVYVLGAAGLMLAAEMSFGQAMLAGVVPFVWKDVLSVVGAQWLVREMERRGFECG